MPLMQPSPATSITVRFGLFEVDLAAAELRKRGRKVQLQDQPFKVLALLLQSPGGVVTREELQRALWPDDTFGDFDEGLNKAIQKLRQAPGARPWGMILLDAAGELRRVARHRQSLIDLGPAGRAAAKPRSGFGI
jgi:DNA-binding response OmpR family regulator